jgi:hypothetical protein
MIFNEQILMRNWFELGYWVVSDPTIENLGQRWPLAQLYIWAGLAQVLHSSKHHDDLEVRTPD